MTRRAWLVAAALILVIASWSAGRAQSKAADFEIGIDAPRGDLKVTCVRGCDWSVEQGDSPLPTTHFQCETERCHWMLDGHGRIRQGMPR